jgi:caffeoyl-CoA O-methyltransferase
MADRETSAQTQELQALRELEQRRAFIDHELTRLFAPEDDTLRAAVAALAEHDMPAIQISPMQGRLLQVLAAACGARNILEIGALSGYSGIWLARSLPADGRLISLEISEKHAAVARASVARAGLADRAEVRVGPGETLLPALVAEAPFDLVFIDADKPGYPTYLDWALRLTRPGSIIVADNCIRSGAPFREGESDPGHVAVRAYDERIASDPRLLSVAFPMDDDGMDGFAVSVVLAPTPASGGPA